MTCELSTCKQPVRAVGSRGWLSRGPPQTVPTARCAGDGTVVRSTVHSRLAYRLRACEGPVVSGGYLGDRAAESALSASIAKSAQSAFLPWSYSRALLPITFWSKEPLSSLLLADMFRRLA